MDIYEIDFHDVFKLYFLPSRFLHANLTPTHSRSQLSGLEGLGDWPLELGGRIHGRQPETEFVGEIVASSTAAGTF